MAPVRPSMCSALGGMSHKAHPIRLWRGRGVPLPVTADETKARCGYVTFFIKQLLRVPLSARWGTQGAPNVTSVPVVVVGQASSCFADQALLQTVRGNRVVGTGSDGEQGEGEGVGLHHRSGGPTVSLIPVMSFHADCGAPL